MALLLQAQRPMWAASSLSSMSRLRPSFHPTFLPSVAVAAAAAAAVTATIEGRRHASVKAQGAYKVKPKKMHPKKYGAKRSGDQYVVPGNIIFTQKGTKWHPGENCTMGRNHTIHAAAAGYVKYYRDPNMHPGRQYIGVTFNREDTLPYPQHAARKRRLNMECIPIEPPKPLPEFGEIGPSGIPERVVQKLGTKGDKQRILKLQPNYSYREDNYALGGLLDKLKTIRKKNMRSRRLHFRMARIKRERRHMRLRTQLREYHQTSMDKVKAVLEYDLKTKIRRRERDQVKAYKAALAEGKTKEEAEQASLSFGPRGNTKESLSMKLKMLALKTDPWRGKNPGAHVKAIRREHNLSLRRVTEAAPSFQKVLDEKRAVMKARAKIERQKRRQKIKAKKAAAAGASSGDGSAGGKESEGKESQAPQGEKAPKT